MNAMTMISTISQLNTIDAQSDSELLAIQCHRFLARLTEAPVIVARFESLATVQNSGTSCKLEPARLQFVSRKAIIRNAPKTALAARVSRAKPEKLSAGHRGGYAQGPGLSL